MEYKCSSRTMNMIKLHSNFTKSVTKIVADLKYEQPICCIICGRVLFLFDPHKYDSFDEYVLEEFRKAFNFLPECNEHQMYRFCSSHANINVPGIHQRQIPEVLKNLSHLDLMSLAVFVPSMKYTMGRSISNNCFGFLRFNGHVLLPRNKQLITKIATLNNIPSPVHDKLGKALKWLINNNHLYDTDAISKLHPRHTDSMAAVWPSLFPYGIDHFKFYAGIQRYTVQSWAKENIFCLDGRFLQLPQFLYYLYIQQELNRAFSQAKIMRTKRKFVEDNNECVARHFLDSSMSSWNELTTVPVSKLFRGSTAYKVDGYLNLHATIYQCGEPTIFFTFTTNMYGWPELRTIFNMYHRYNKNLKFPEDMGPFLPVVFRRRLQKLLYFITHNWARSVGGLQWYYYVFEENANGYLHVHFIARTGMTPEELAEHNTIASSYMNCWDQDEIDLLMKYQIHHCTSYCLHSSKCRFDYPRDLNPHKTFIDDTGHVIYTCFSEDDRHISPCQIQMLQIMGSSMNAQIIPRGFSASYLNKYFTKQDDHENVLLPVDPTNENSSQRISVVQYLAEQTISVPRIVMSLYGWNLVSSTREVSYISPIASKRNHGVLLPLSILRTDPDSENAVYPSDVLKYLQRNAFYQLTFPQFNILINATNGVLKKRSKNRVVRSYYFNPTYGELYYHQQLMYTIPAILSHDIPLEHTYRFGYSSFEQAYIELYGERNNQTTQCLNIKRLVLMKSTYSGSMLHTDNLDVIQRPPLNQHQQKIVDWILSDSTSKVCLGVPGSGKSYIISFLREHYERLGFMVIILAPTGITSLAYDAVTVHSFFRLATKKKVGKVPFITSSIRDLESLSLHEVDKSKVVFLVDEVGQISAQMHSCMNRKMQFVGTDTSYFGGYMIHWFGDFFQAEPPDGDYIFEDPEFNHLHVRELTQSQRHIDDPSLARLLQLLRCKKPPKDSIWDLIKPCLNRHPNLDYVTLLPTKQQINNYIEALDIDYQFTYPAVVFHMSTNDVSEEYTSCYFSSCDLEQYLKLKSSMRILVTKNFEIDGLKIRNGMLGKILSLHDDYVVVNLDKYPGLSIKLARYIWVCPNTGVHIAQFPIIQAIAMTINRIQSTTQPGINIMLSPIFASGLVISGLGRSTSLSTISIIGDLKIDDLLNVSPKVRRFYESKKLN